MNQILEDLLPLVLANTLVAGGLGGLAMVVTRLRLGASLAHGLWVLAFLKLVTPPLFTVEMPFALPVVADAQDTAPPATVPSTPIPESLVEVLEAGDAALLHQLLAERPDLGSPGGEPEAEPELAPTTMAPAVDVPPIDWAAWLFTGWAAGAAGLLLLSLSRAARFHRQLRFAGRADRTVRRELAQLAQRMGVRRVPEVLVLPGRISPMLWGFFGPARIVLPSFLANRLSAEQRRTLLAHELAHFHRRDHWVRLLELLTRALYWWNPLVWWASARLRHVEEECCDAWVLWTLPDASRSYADALIDTIEYLSDAPRSLPAPASGVGQVTDLKNRLRNIMIENHSRRLSRWSRATVLLLAAVTLPLVPATGQEHKRRAAEEARVKAEMQARQAERQARQAEAQARFAAKRARRIVETEIRDVEAQRDSDQWRRHAERQASDQERQRMLRALKRAMHLLKESDHHADANTLARLIDRFAARPDPGRASKRDRERERANRREVEVRDRMDASKVRAELHTKLRAMETEVEHAHRQGRHEEALHLAKKMQAVRKQHEQTRRDLAVERQQFEQQRARANQLEMTRRYIAETSRRPRAGEADRVRRLEQQVQHLTEMVKKLVDDRSRRRTRAREEVEEVEAEEVEAEEVVEEELVEEIELIEKTKRKAEKAKRKADKTKRETRTRNSHGR